MSYITTLTFICDSCGLTSTVVLAYQGLQGCEFTTNNQLPPGWKRTPIIGTSLRTYHQCERCIKEAKTLPP